MKHVLLALVAFVSIATMAGCGDGTPEFDRAVSPVRTDLTYFKDAEGRYVHFHGVNVSGDAKVPNILDVPLSNGRDFTFVGRPFPIDEADQWFAQIKSIGFNAIRLLFIWEAVFPDSRDTPDEEFLDYFEQIVSKANEHGIYVLVNMHENLWGRDMVALYNEDAKGERGDIENWLYALLPPYTNKVIGDGAPHWASKACMPYKNFESEHWGQSYLLGALAKDDDGIPGSDFLYTVSLVAGILGFELPEGLLAEIEAELPGRFDRSETAGMLPLSGWWDNVIFSLDIQRCYMAFYGGDKAFPSTAVEPDGTVKNRNDDEVSDQAMDLKEYLQGSFTQAWVEVAKRVGKYPNIIGYDIQNEPVNSFYVYAALTLFFEVGNEDAVKELLNTLLPNDLLVNGTPLELRLPFEPEDTCDTGCSNVCGTACATDCDATCDSDCETMCAADCDATCGADASCLALCNQEKSDCTALCVQNEETCSTQCAQQKNTCNKLCGNQVATCIEMCQDPTKDQIGTKLYYILKFLEILPPDTEWETRVKWGFGDADLMGVIGMIDAFDYFLLQPLFERVGTAIQEVDPDAIIWIEPSGMAGLNGTYMTKPAGVNSVVYSPHYYPDIYPWLGVNMPERDFSPDEIRFRDFTEDLRKSADFGAYTLSNVPVAFGEFGTYWNFKYKGEPWEEKGIVQSLRNDYAISAHFLDNYYEAYENLFMSNFLWCYSINNTYENGEGWNHEDFSVIDPQQEPRGALAWSRPYAAAMSGKPVSTHFYSDYHYFDPEKGIPDPVREFELVMESRETDAATLIFVPEVQYPEGFLVWLSDGWIAWDQSTRTLQYHPTKDEPGWRHKVVIRPPISGQTTEGWNYFIKDGSVIGRQGGLGK